MLALRLALRLWLRPRLEEEPLRLLPLLLSLSLPLLPLLYLLLPLLLLLDALLLLLLLPLFRLRLLLALARLEYFGVRGDAPPDNECRAPASAELSVRPPLVPLGDPRTGVATVATLEEALVFEEEPPATAGPLNLDSVSVPLAGDGAQRVDCLLARGSTSATGVRAGKLLGDATD